MANNDQFINSLVQTDSHNQSGITTESRIQQQSSSGMPWWGYVLAGAGILAAGKIGGGLLRSIDLLAGEAAIAKSGISAAKAAEKFGTVTAQDITSTLFGRLAFTKHMIGQPNVFLSNALLKKVPSVYSMLFNTKTIGSIATDAFQHIPGVQKGISSVTDYIVGLQNKYAEKSAKAGGFFSSIADRFRGIAVGDKYFEASEILEKNVGRKAGRRFENENYFVPQIVKQLDMVSKIINNADEETAAQLRQSISTYMQQQTDMVENKAKRLSLFGLSPISYAEHIKKFGLQEPTKIKAQYNEARRAIGKDILPEWENIAQLPASPDLFTTKSGKMARVYSPSKIAIDYTRKLLQSVHIPYLGFNPLTLLQPGFMEEMSNQQFAVELNAKNFVPYKKGITTVADIAKELGMQPDKAKMYIIGNKSYLSSGEKVIAVPEIGNIYALKSHNVSSTINRIYSFETGMYRGGVQKADVPFNNKNNVEGSIIEELHTAYGRATGAKLKRWRTSLASGDAFEMLKTVSEMHNTNQHTLGWRLLAEKMGIYDLPLEEQQKMFAEYIKLARRGAFSISKLEGNMTSAQRNALYHFFSPTTKETKFFDLISSKGSEALTDRYLNQKVADSLTYTDVLAIGATKRKIGLMSPRKVNQYIQSVSDYFGDNSKAPAFTTFLHLFTEYQKSQILVHTEPDKWINSFVKFMGTSKINAVFAGAPMEEIIRQHAAGAKAIYKTATGFSFLQRMFTNLEQTTKNVTRLTSHDYLLLGKMRSPWETKAQGGSLKDWAMQLFPTPSTFSRRSSVPGLLLHWLVERPYDLLEYTGLGRPNYSTTYNAASTLGSFLLRRILPLYLGIAGAGYSAYLIKKYTGVDVKKPTYEYAKRVGIGALRASEYTGITPLLSAIHTHYPGILTLASAAYGQYTSNVRTAMLFGSMMSFVENVPSARKTALALYGVNQVPVRAGRWWELGSDPFQGGRVKYFRPSLAYLASTDWKYSSTLWGNQTNYWKYGSMLPTPTNLFDILPLFARDKFFAQTHQADRPYGFIGTGIMNTQAEQSLRQSTGVGAVYGGTLAIASYKQSEKQTRNTMKQIQQQASVIRAKSLHASIGVISKYMQEYPGMPGFLASAALSKFGGNQRQIYIPSPGYIGRSDTQYYQNELGSVFGLSELFRRILPNQHPWYDVVTGNIPNTQPSWIPQRFQFGDPYAQIEFGEVRLPGEAYLETHPLSGGEYSPAQQMMINANLSPRSSEYYNAVSKLHASPPHTAGERYTMFEAAKQHQAILMGNASPISPYSIKLTKEKIKLGKYLGQGVFENPDNPNAVITFAGTQASYDAIAANLFQTQNITLEQAYQKAKEKEQQLNKYLESLSGNSVEAVVPADNSMRYRMLMSGGLVEEVYAKGINKKLLGFGAMPTDNTTMSYFATHNAFLSSKWEHIRHYDNFFIQKFGGSEDAIEYYRRNLYSGALFQNWASPISSFMLPALLKPTGEGFQPAMASGFLTGMFGSAHPAEGIIPSLGLGLFNAMESFLPTLPTPQNKKRIELENKYMLAEYYLGKNNLFGNQLPSLKDIEEQLPQPESEYFPQFLNAPASKRSEISNMVPEAERYLLQEYWQLKDMIATGKIQASHPSAIEEVINPQESKQILARVNQQAENLNLAMARRSYVDKISLAINAMHEQSMIQPTYSSAGMDLTHKQKRGSEMAYYYGSSNTNIGYNGSNSLNLRRSYGR